MSDNPYGLGPSDFYYDPIYIDYLLNQPPQFFLPFDEDELGLYGKYLTQENKLAGINADPSYLIMNNLLPASAYDPVPEYEVLDPEDAYAYDQFLAAQSGTPFQKFVYDALSGEETGVPLTTGEIIAGLQALPEADMDEDEKQAILGSLPTAFEDPNTIDWDRVSMNINDLVQARRNLGDLESIVQDPNTGDLARVSMVDSPMMEDVKRLGYTVAPGTPFTEDMLATEEQLAEADRAQRAGASAMQSFDEVMEEYKEFNRKMAEARKKRREREGDIPEESGSGSGSGTSADRPIERIRRLSNQPGEGQMTTAALGVADTRSGRDFADRYYRYADRGYQPSQRRSSNRPGRIRGTISRGIRRRRPDQFREQLQAQRERRMAATAAGAQAIYERRMRERMAQDLASRGIDQFSVQNRIRNPFYG